MIFPSQFWDSTFGWLCIPDLIPKCLTKVLNEIWESNIGLKIRSRSLIKQSFQFVRTWKPKRLRCPWIPIACSNVRNFPARRSSFQRQTFFIKLVSYSQAYFFKLGVLEDCFSGTGWRFFFNFFANYLNWNIWYDSIEH